MGGSTDTVKGLSRENEQTMSEQEPATGFPIPHTPPHFAFKHLKHINSFGRSLSLSQT